MSCRAETPSQRASESQKGKSTGKQFQPSATNTSFTGHRQPNFRSNSRSFTASKANTGDICFEYGQRSHWRSECRGISQLFCLQVLEVNKSLPANLLNKYLFYLTYLVVMSLSTLDFFRQRDSSLLVDFDYDRNLFEFEQGSALSVLKGRLKKELDYWYTIGTNKFVIDTFNFGYRIPFISTPCKAFSITISQLWTMHLSLSPLFLN